MKIEPVDHGLATRPLVVPPTAVRAAAHEAKHAPTMPSPDRVELSTDAPAKTDGKGKAAAAVVVPSGDTMVQGLVERTISTLTGRAFRTYDPSALARRLRPAEGAPPPPDADA